MSKIITIDNVQIYGISAETSYGSEVLYDIDLTAGWNRFRDSEEPAGSLSAGRLSLRLNEPALSVLNSVMKSQSQKISLFIGVEEN